MSGTPKTIRQLTAIGRALLATDLFASAEPSPALTDATHVTAQDIADFIGAVVAAANNGLWTNAGFIQWGQPFAQAGNPAALLHSIEIPDGGNLIFFGPNDGVSEVIGFDVIDGLVQISNQSSGQPSFVIFDGNNWAFEATTFNNTAKIGEQGGVCNFTFDPGSNEIISNETLVPLRSFKRGTPSPLTGNTNFPTRTTGTFYQCDSSGGNVDIFIDPIVNEGNNMVFKKISADANLVTIFAQSGTIQELGAAAASVVFSGQGESLSVFSDGTNLFCY